MSTLAGSGSTAYNASTSGVAVGSANLHTPVGLVASDTGGAVYFSDFNHQVIQKIEGGNVYLLKGDGTAADPGSPGNRFYAPSHMAMDSSGNLYIADLGNSVIRKVTNGIMIIETFAGDHASVLSLAE